MTASEVFAGNLFIVSSVIYARSGYSNYCNLRDNLVISMISVFQPSCEHYQRSRTLARPKYRTVGHVFDDLTVAVPCDGSLEW